MAHTGKIQLTMTFTTAAENVAEGDRIFATHAKWMEASHHRDGELALLSYNVHKGPEFSNPLDPTSDPTGRTIYVVTEVYESEAGLADHWKRGAEDWEDFGALMEWVGKGEITFCHGSPVIYSLW